jgi:hypothetical protein
MHHSRQASAAQAWPPELTFGAGLAQAIFGAASMLSRSAGDPRDRVMKWRSIEKASMREPNEIDFWRGFALLTIFVNHIPGNFFERFTFRNISLSDSAELFVFLAGWAMRKLIDGPARSHSGKWLMFRLGGRALTVYFAQTVITGLAIALLAGASLLLDAPFLLDWHNASAVFNDPVGRTSDLSCSRISSAISTYCRFISS